MRRRWMAVSRAGRGFARIAPRGEFLPAFHLLVIGCCATLRAEVRHETIRDHHRLARSIGHFADIEEDEDPQHLLASDDETWLS